MRVSDTMLSGSFLSTLNKSREKISNLRTEIARGTKIAKPSDSPDGAVKLLRLSNQLGESDIYQKNIGNSQSFIKETTFGMETIQNEVVKVMGLLAESQNAGINNFESFADQIDSSINAILDASNSTYDGKFLFGGTDESASPYGYTADGKNIETKTTSTSGVQKIKISSSSLQRINVPGSDLFGNVDAAQKTDIFNKLIEIRDTFRSGNGVTNAQEQFVTSFNQKILSKISETGNIANQLDDTQELLTNHSSVIEGLMAKEQTVDVAKAVVDLQNEDYILQLTYKVSSSILPKSLLDYL